MTAIDEVGARSPALPADEADLRARQHRLLVDHDLLDVPGDAELDAVVRVAGHQHRRRPQRAGGDAGDDAHRRRRDDVRRQGRPASRPDA